MAKLQNTAHIARLSKSFLKPGDKVEPHHLSRLQDAVDRLSTELDINRRPQLSGEFIEKEDGSDLDGITLTVDIVNLVCHGMGRKVRGWKIVDQDAPAYIYRVTTAGANPDETTYLALGTTATVTVKLEVF